MCHSSDTHTVFPQIFGRRGNESGGLPTPLIKENVSEVDIQNLQSKVIKYVISHNVLQYR